MMLKSFEISMFPSFSWNVPTCMPSYGKSMQIRRPKRRPRPLASPQVLRRLELALRHSEAFGGSGTSLVIFVDDFYGSICLKPSMYHQNCGPHIIIYDWFMILGQFDRWCLMGLTSYIYILCIYISYLMMDGSPVRLYWWWYGSILWWYMIWLNPMGTTEKSLV